MGVFCIFPCSWIPVGFKESGSPGIRGVIPSGSTGTIMGEPWRDSSLLPYIICRQAAFCTLPTSWSTAPVTARGSPLPEGSLPRPNTLPSALMTMGPDGCQQLKTHLGPSILLLPSLTTKSHPLLTRTLSKHVLFQILLESLQNPALILLTQLL